MMRPLLLAGIATVVLSGCSVVGDLPGMGRLADLMWRAPDAPDLRPVEAAGAQPQPVPAPLFDPDPGEGALAETRGTAGWIVDPETNCATSNPFARPDETIRWYGACEDGRLSGPGTLVWSVEGIESERNEGTFRAGEFHGEVITTYPDGEVIVGNYVDGVRDGEFVVIRDSGRYIRAVYDQGELISEGDMTVAEAEAWRNRRVAAFPDVLLAQAARQAPQVSASPAADRQVVAEAPAAPEVMAALLASGERAVPQEPRVVLARVEPAQRAMPVPQPPAAAETGGGTPAGLWSAPAAGSPHSQRTAHITQVLGGPASPAVATSSAWARRTEHVSQVLGGTTQVAALAPAPVFRPAPVSYSAAPVPEAETSLSSLDTTVIGGDGRAQPLAASSAGVQVAASPLPLSEPQQPWRDPRGAGALAGEYAGRDGPWVVGSDGASAQPLEPEIRAVPVMPVQSRPLPPRPLAPADVAAPGGDEAAAADRLFADAYRFELAGRFAEAERLYHDILMNHPSASAAMLANARLESLQRSRGTVQVAQNTGETGYVVSANSPAPRYSGLPPTGTAGNPALALESPLINRTVCTQPGVYADDARWCGIVTFDEGAFMRVEVREVELNGFGQIGITRSTCTGNTFLTWFSRGTTVRVPKRCMAVVG